VTEVSPQDELLALLVKGKNVLLHGPGGTGKSYTIRNVVTELRNQGFSVACTAATGIAAINLSGEGMTAMTMHKWGIGGLGDKPIQYLIQDISSKKYIVDRWRSTSILFIDEISMIGKDFFTKLSQIAKYIRRSTEPFGGIRVVASGDFLQLPPVGDGGWVFNSSEWEECDFQKVDFIIPKRYEDQRWFQTLLRIREGKPSDEDISLLESRKEAYDNLVRQRNQDLRTGYVVLPTNLYSTKNSTDQINYRELEKLPGEEIEFEAGDEVRWFDTYLDRPISRRHKTSAYYDQFLDDAIPRKVSFKVGAQVMLKRNIDQEAGLVNGSRGVVVEIPSETYCVKVKWTNDLITTVTPITWEKIDEDAIASRTQIPLVLAWAMTIHKSQGCTLDRVVCDVGKEIFSPGQAYVALSRVRSIEGLYLRSFIPKSIFADADALKYLFGSS
jgi:ATP-dependent DNA helicase PIF1